MLPRLLHPLKRPPAWHWFAIVALAGAFLRHERASEAKIETMAQRLTGISVTHDIKMMALQAQVDELETLVWNDEHRRMQREGDGAADVSRIIIRTAATSSAPTRGRRAQGGAQQGICHAADLEMRVAEVGDTCCDAHSGHGHRLLQADCALPGACPSVECAITFTSFYEECGAGLEDSFGLALSEYEPLYESCRAVLQASSSLAMQLGVSCTQDEVSEEDCIPTCSATRHGYLLLLNIDGEDRKFSCQLHHTVYSWLGGAGDGGYIGSDPLAFVSALISAAPGAFFLTLLADAGITRVLTVTPGQSVSITSDPSLGQAPRLQRLSADNSCVSAYNDYCEDGSPRALYEECPLGTDSFDCGTVLAGGGFVVEPRGSLSLSNVELGTTTLTLSIGSALSLASTTVTASILAAAVRQLGGAGSKLRLEDVTVQDFRETGAHEIAITVNDDRTRTVEGSMAFGLPTFAVTSGHSCDVFSPLLPGIGPTNKASRDCLVQNDTAPCTVSHGGRCVGRSRGYSAREECRITVTGGAGLLGSCSVFDTEPGIDVVALPGGDTRGGSDCPEGTPLLLGDELVWYSDGNTQGFSDEYGIRETNGCAEKGLCGLPVNHLMRLPGEPSDYWNSPVGVLGGGWEICFEPPVRGCTTPTASNYDPAATVNDGSCANLLGADGSFVDGTISAPGETQTWPFRARAGQHYEIETEMCAELDCLTDTVMQLLDTDGTTVLAESDNDWRASGRRDSFIEWVCPRKGIYTVRVGANAAQEIGRFQVWATENTVSGCTSPSATNFNAAANVDDGSCSGMAPVLEVAEGKPAIQSGTAYGGVASRAVDGNTNGDYIDGGSCTEIPVSRTEWWQVDLLQSYDIRSVFLWHRTDPCCTDTLLHATVIVSDTPDYAAGTPCGILDGNLGQPDETACSHSGRYVTVVRHNSHMNICEVKVMATATTGCTCPAAGNYDPRAQYDDGSCRPLGGCCTNPTATNYNPEAAIDDGSCDEGRTVGARWETWDDVSGTQLVDLTSSSAYIVDMPASMGFLTPPATLAAPLGENAAIRLSTFFRAPVSGVYVFVIAAGGQGELWFGSDESVLQRIATGAGSSGPRDYMYTHQHTQQQPSAPQYLEAGSFYALRALHNGPAGRAILSVGVTLPGGEELRPIPTQGYLFAGEAGCQDRAALNFSPWASDDDGSCILCDGGSVAFNGVKVCPVPGCTTPAATNYDPLATADDSSCVCDDGSAPTEVDDLTVDCAVTGCTNPAALNYDPAANIDGGSCTCGNSGGNVVWETWEGIPGSAVGDLTSSPAYIAGIPTRSGVLGTCDLLEVPSDANDNVGNRLTARFLAPQTGDYIFVIASDDQGELWLGEDEAAATLIASVPGWTRPRQWDKFPAQTSAPQSLAAGNYYFLMALAKESGGGDNLAVGVTLPDGVSLRPIPVAGYLF